MMTSQVVRALEAKGLVRRDSDPHDRRARALSATPDGVALANRAVVAVEAGDQQFFGVLGDLGPYLQQALTALARA